MDTASSGPTAIAEGHLTQVRRTWSLRTYVAALVVLFAVAAGSNVVYQRGAAEGDARNAAIADAGFAAQMAAREIATEIDAVRTAVAATASNPGVMQAFLAPTAPASSGGAGAPAGGPAGGPAARCSLRFAGAGALGGGHLDLVRRDGTVACSSLVAGPAGRPRGYGSAVWLSAALDRPQLAGPVVDARTGTPAMVLSAPVPGDGVVVGFVDLVRAGPGLSSTFGGPRNLEFVVTSADGHVVLARSINSARWAGTPVASDRLAASGQVAHRDLDGVSRLYGQATVAGTGWRVYAGASKSAVLAAADGRRSREIAITLGGLIVFLGAALVLSRRIARPITELSAAVRAAAEHSSPGPIAVDGPTEIARLADDCNELIAAASRELAAMSRLDAIVETSTDAIFGKTLDGVITSWNSGAEAMFGYTAGEMVGHNISELVPADRAGELAPIFDRVRRGERVVHLDTRRMHRGGGILDLSISVSPIRDETGAVVGASTVSRDVTERNRAEADRRVLQDRLLQSERLESLGQLAGGIAHDFNNLLGAIMNYAAFVAEATADKPAVQADVRQIQAAADRAARLTKQLLIFARRDTIKPATLDLNAIVADIQNLLSRSIGKHIRLVVEPEANLPTIRADLGQVEQVLLNLAVNARDAMPDGGTLTIETRRAELDEGYARLHPDVTPGHYVELAVSDTGTGMSEEVASHILEPFYTTKPKGQGTGLGLATVYGIVSEAGGSMTIYSEPGIGTTFRLYFPATGSFGPSARSANRIQRRGKGETIFVVEDDPAVLEATSQMLRRNGYGVLEASTFAEALSVAAAHDFQLLLTDSVMPDMSGRVLAGHIDHLRPGRAVLFMSGYSAGVLHPQQVLDEGAPILHKPFNEQTLLEGVRRAMGTSTGAPPDTPHTPDTPDA